MRVIHRGNRASAVRAVGKFVQDLADDERFTASLAESAHADVIKAYKVKNQGVRAEDGIQWPPVKPSTIAGRRFRRDGIMIDSESLLESLRPESEPGMAAVVSDDPRASYHQRGVPAHNVPPRPIFPDRVPRSWWRRWIDRARPVILRIAAEALR